MPKTISLLDCRYLNGERWNLVFVAKSELKTGLKGAMYITAREIEKKNHERGVEA
jgi:hypothetical protein